jgi:hypothetical protein
MPTKEISIGAGDYAIEGLVPQFDPELVLKSGDNQLPPEVLDETSRIYERICKAEPEFRDRVTNAAFAATVVRFSREEGEGPRSSSDRNKVLVVISIKEAQ